TSLLRAGASLVGFLAVLALLSNRGPAVLSGGLAALVGLDLLNANARLSPTVPLDFYRAPGAVRAIRSDHGPRGRVWCDASPRARAVSTRVVPGMPVDEVLRLSRERLEGYTAASYGLDLAFNYDVAATAPLAYEWLRSVVEEAPLERKLRLLGAAG